MRKWLAKILAKNDKSQVGFWPLQGDVVDYSGLGTHGNPNRYFPMYEGGRKGLIFSNVIQSNGVTIPLGNSNVYNFDTTDSFTISTWYYYQPLHAGGSSFLVSRIYNNSQNSIIKGYGLFVTNDNVSKDKLGFVIYSGLNTYPIASLTLTVDLNPIWQVGDIMNKWYHIAVVYNVGVINLYVNGVLATSVVSSTLQSSSMQHTQGILQLAGDAGAVYTDLGTATILYAGMSTTRIWNRALPTVEVMANYTSERDMYRPRSRSMAWPTTDNSCTLYMNGSLPVVTNITPLFISGPSPANSGTPLYIHGQASLSSGVPLSLTGAIIANNAIPMYINGVLAKQEGMNLSLICTARKFTTPPALPLNITGSTSGTQGLIKPITLFTQGNMPSANHSLNMALIGAEKDNSLRHMNLFTQGEAYPAGNTAPLFVCNTSSGVNNSTPLTISGSSWWSGGGTTPPPTGAQLGSSLNLYIKRWPSNAVPLFMCCASPANQGAPMYIRGATTSESGIPLVIPSTLGDMSGIPPLFVSGY
jgi:hypothetical protein